MGDRLMTGYSDEQLEAIKALYRNQAAKLKSELHTTLAKRLALLEHYIEKDDPQYVKDNKDDIRQQMLEDVQCDVSALLQGHIRWREHQKANDS
jgi:hypothetical protein